MCGIVGFISPQRQDAAQQLVAVASTMSKTLQHRGPDDAGVWVDERFGVALAHRRLAVLDLSPAGSQPMACAAGRHIMVFNGEIYNHLDLRAKLGDREWRGHSDTETLLAAVAAWGLETALRETVGMFALALWDRETRQLFLARDRMGEKPLYYGWQGHSFLFGSELKALKRHPSFSGEIDRASLSSFMRHGYVPAPHSIYRALHKLAPGTYLSLSGAATPGTLPQPSAYWSLLVNAVQGQESGFGGTPSQAAEQLEAHISRALSVQMIADVPLGALLSGGIDSSVIAALMQAQASRPVKTFSIGFKDAKFDEAPHARAIARHLGTDHTELYVGTEDLMEVIPKLPTMFDEPFGDSSAIPTFLVSRLAREHVTVALSGDGGDELFGGYSRYRRAQTQWNRIRHIPLLLRQSLARLALAFPDAPRRRMALAAAFAAGDDLAFYRVATSQWPCPRSVVIAGEHEGHDREPLEARPAGSMLERMMLTDSMVYLPDDILTKVDRAAMATSLETRVPLLDHRLVEFAWTLPLDMKVRRGETKWLLRKVLERYVPKSLTDRPKMGFGVPLDGWLRGPLRDWAEGMLDATRLTQQGFLSPEPIRQAWSAHLSGRSNLRDPLWSVLMFQAWLAAEVGDSA